jgi:3-oxoacyl-[acyl-carrier-protein] synthase II
VAARTFPVLGTGAYNARLDENKRESIMTRSVVVSGVGPVNGLGLGIERAWEGVVDGRSAIGPIQAFDPSGFGCQLGAEVEAFKIGKFVPKSHRKMTKVMARDIELAVIAADYAARDAGLATKGTDPDAGKNGDFDPTYDPARVGCHIGAGLIAADLDELTTALDESRGDDGAFDIHKWGSEGITHLTPLWLLKYLPNMLACHVTIIHDTQGPSNTITCGEASALLSIGESLRVIQRGSADLCFCGGAECKMNPMVYNRQQLTGRLNETSNDDPAGAVRPFDAGAAGSVAGDGGGIVMLEAMETYQARGGTSAYAQVVGFGASQSVNREKRNMEPDAQGRAVVTSVKAALREAGIGPDGIDLVIGYGCGVPAWDNAEAAGYRQIFGDRLADVPVVSLRAQVGNCGAGGGGIDVAIAAKAIKEQKIPAIVNRDSPVDGLGSSAPARDAKLNNVLVFNMGLGGQNTALILKKLDS